MSGQGFSVTGIDVSARMLEKARKLNLKNARFLLADAAEYFSDEQFGGVIAFDSLWHLSRNKQLEAYFRIGAMLKRGGYFLFTHGKREGETSGEMFGEKFFYCAHDMSAVTDVLRRNGMEIVALTEDYREETTGHRELLVVARKSE